MIFLFRILMFIHCISTATNYVVTKNIEENDQLLLPNGVSNKSFPTDALFEAVEEFSSKRKLEHYHIDKSFSGGILSNKENINDAGLAHTSERHKNRPNDEPPTLQFERDRFDERNINNSFDNRRLLTEQYNDLQSGSKDVERELECQIEQNSKQVIGDTDTSNIRRSARMCTGCTRSTMFYAVTVMPYYVPYQPYLNYAPYLFNDGFNKFIQQNKDGIGSNETPGSVIGTETLYEYDKSNIEWDTAFLEARPDVLVEDLLNDLYISYPNAVIRKCYCSNSASQARITISCTICGLVIYLLCNVVK